MQIEFVSNKCVVQILLQVAFRHFLLDHSEQLLPAFQDSAAVATEKAMNGDGVCPRISKWIRQSASILKSTSGQKVVSHGGMTSTDFSSSRRSFLRSGLPFLSICGAYKQM